MELLKKLCETDGIAGNEVSAAWPGPNPQASTILGAILFGLGVFFLAQNLGWPWFGWLNFGALWPLILIIVGGISVWRTVKSES